MPKTPEAAGDHRAGSGQPAWHPGLHRRELLQALLGGISQTTYVDREEYDVYLRANQRDFSSVSDLSRIYLKAANGEMVTLSTLATVKQVASPQRLNHYQRQKAVTLTADLAPGHTLGEALDYLDGWASANLPSGMTVDYAGESRTIATTRARW